MLKFHAYTTPDPYGVLFVCFHYVFDQHVTKHNPARMITRYHPVSVQNGAPCLCHHLARLASSSSSTLPLFGFPFAL